MPSLLVGSFSGGLNILSGVIWSGRTPEPVGGVQLLFDPNGSGTMYVALSGNMTVNSGPCQAGAVSGSWFSGLLDGMPIKPGVGYFIPKLGCGLSGQPAIYVSPDATASGQRLYWETY